MARACSCCDCGMPIQPIALSMLPMIMTTQLGFPDAIPAEVPADAATNEEFLQAAHHALLEVRCVMK